MTQDGGNIPDGPRFAFYLVPSQQDPLTQKAAAWLGRDPWTNGSIRQPVFSDIDPTDFERATAAPRRYGFHGTITAPFELSDTTSPASLRDAAFEFANGAPPLQVRLRPKMLGPFLALLPDDQAELSNFAERVVKTFHSFRTPLSDYDRERRKTSRLTPRQLRNLDRWGYPYVMEDFFFHMTLSGPLTDAHTKSMQQAADEWFASALDSEIRFDGFALFYQGTRQETFVIDRFFSFNGC